MVEEGEGKFAENHQTDWSGGDFRRRGVAGPKKGELHGLGTETNFWQAEPSTRWACDLFLTWSILSLPQIVLAFCLRSGIIMKNRGEIFISRDFFWPTCHSNLEFLPNVSFQKMFVELDFFHAVCSPPKRQYCRWFVVCCLYFHQCFKAGLLASISALCSGEIQVPHLWLSLGVLFQGWPRLDVSSTGPQLLLSKQFCK